MQNEIGRETKPNQTGWRKLRPDGHVIASTPPGAQHSGSVCSGLFTYTPDALSYSRQGGEARASACPAGKACGRQGLTGGPSCCNLSHTSHLCPSLHRVRCRHPDTPDFPLDFNSLKALERTCSAGEHTGASKEPSNEDAS